MFSVGMPPPVLHDVSLKLGVIHYTLKVGVGSGVQMRCPLEKCDKLDIQLLFFPQRFLFFSCKTCTCIGVETFHARTVFNANIVRKGNQFTLISPRTILVSTFILILVFKIGSSS